jgi:integrase
MQRSMPPIPDVQVIVIPSGIKRPVAHQKPDGRWEVKPMVAGKRSYFSGRTPEAAQLAWLRAMHPELLPASGLSPIVEGQPRTVNELLDFWLKSVRRQVETDEKSPATYKDYHSVARRLVRVAPILDRANRDEHRPLGNMGIFEVTAESVDIMLHWIQTARGLSPSQAAQARTALQAAYSWARRKLKMQIDNPVDLAETVRVDTAQASGIPTPVEVRQFLASAEADGDSLLGFWRAAFTTGARAGEIAGMREDLLIGSEGQELPNKWKIWNQAQLIKDPESELMVWHARSPKRHSRRTIGLSALTAGALVAAANATASRRAAHPEWDPRWDGYVFRRRDGTPYPSSEISTIFSERLKKAGLQHWNFHLATRHFAASAWISAGHSMWRIARRLGHRDTTMVERVYGHLFEEVDPRDAADMERILAEWLPASGSEIGEEDMRFADRSV